MSSAIEDYAIIGDMRTAALVSKQGSIDWFCAPRFDSGACFAALLGSEQHGRWKISPVDPHAKSTHAYRHESLILETTHQTKSGTVVVTDWMPLHTNAPLIARRIECTKGEMEIESLLSVRFDYGCIVPWVQDEDGRRIVLTAGPDALVFTSDIPHERNHELHAGRAVVRMHQGQRLSMQLAYGRSYEPFSLAIDLETALRTTEAYWSEWSTRCTYHGKWREHVMRSLITLKALTYEPTGGIVAAATTSLPEAIGGPRNWDYRFCWLRDATFTLLALVQAGYHQEANKWQEWLLRTVAGDPSQLQVLYGVAGERRIAEFEVPWLEGYKNSQPVRIGNAASGQFQLDIYGEVVDALMHTTENGSLPSVFAQNVIRSLVDFVARHRSVNDSGMWEIRGETRAFTHSRVMAWVAFDRGVALAEAIHDIETADRWRIHRDELHAEVLEHGYDQTLGSFVQSYGSKKLDASSLLIPQVGFLPVDDPRVLSTVTAIERDLLEGGFVLRYRSDDPQADGLPGHDNAFLACSFWLANTYALVGREKDAHALYQRLTAVCNYVGLLSEEYDVSNNCLVGNIPQAFSHVGLVTAALNFEAIKNGRPNRRERMSDHRKGTS